MATTMPAKIVAVKAEMPDLKIYSEKDLKARVELEVNLVKQVENHVSTPLFLLYTWLTLIASGQYCTIHSHTGIQDRREY